MGEQKRNNMRSSAPIQRLREQLAALQPAAGGAVGEGFALGFKAADEKLEGLRRAALHEVFAPGVQASAANGFALALALRATNRALVWVFETRALAEAGGPYGPGLREWGVDPAGLILVRVRDAPALLAAGEEALRSRAVGAVLMSGWGEGKAHTLTASRRLAMAADQGGATALLARIAAEPQPSAADSRWWVEAAPSAALEARAPGRPAFRARLLRSRAGLPPQDWIMEWDREARSFVEPQKAVSGGLVSLPAQRQAGQGDEGRWRRAG